MSVQEFNALVAEFLATEKTAYARPRWQTARHPDYAEAKFLVAVPGSRALVGLVVLTAHRVRLPPKYGLSLIFRGQRVLGLDINPGRTHKNLFVRASVGGTHWQRWPTMDAEPDDRDQTFTVWLRDFLQTGNIVTTFGVLSPPRGVQLRLVFDGDKGNNGG
jgi:hypothetical protein